MPTITAEARAKINLWLAVGEKRPDGYHDIESVMQSVSLCDLVSVTRNPDRGEKKIAVHMSDPSLPSDRRNIVWKCAEAFSRPAGSKSTTYSSRSKSTFPPRPGWRGDPRTVRQRWNC